MISKGRFLTLAEQVADYLRSEIEGGRWRETLPGLRHLAEELEVNFKTVSAAFEILEEEGVLVAQGAGRRRRIVAPKTAARRSLRVAILQFEPLNQTEGYLLELHHLLEEAGFEAFFMEKSLLDLEMSLKRVARLVARTDADAWIVVVGSRQILEWFLSQGIPVFAMFGRRRGVKVASTGPDKEPAYTALTRRLVELGHQRIVLMARRARRLPEPGRIEQAFLDELNRAGVQSGPYHLPDWDENREGFHACLDSLFSVTPPTALIIDEARFFFAAQQHLMNRRLTVPGDVSLICTDAHSVFDWCQPTVAHIRWDSRPVLRRIVRWVDKVSKGQEDRRQRFTRAEFVDGGTVGPAKGRRRRRRSRGGS